MKASECISLILKGIGMGAANVVPGVSGGTIAFVTGIYERLVKAIGSFDREAVKLLFSGRHKDFWKHIDGSFLMAVLLGVALATVSLAKLMLILLESYAIQTWAFFFGLIIASSILILKDIKGWVPLDALWLLAGGILGVAVCTLSPVETPDALWFIFVCGAISICAMILPGISGSFILLVMGKYEYVMNAIDGAAHFNAHSAAVLLIFLAGCLVGILAFAKLLRFLLGRWNRQTVLALSGFVLGSLVKVWPWNSYDPAAGSLSGGPHIPAAILLCIAGAALVLGLEWLGAAKRKKD